jgi:Predicted Fe-S-cluster oxidoreductase
MNKEWIDIAEEICRRCGGICCVDAHPPVSTGRKDLMVRAGTSENVFEFYGYQRLAARSDGTCIMMKNGRCQVHGIKPETCISGPFTFDLHGNVLEIYLKRESLCPLVRYLKEDREAYDCQYEMAVKNITSLVEEIPRSELEVIVRIPEPETDKVAEIILTRGYV